MADEHFTFDAGAVRRIVRAVLKSERDGADRRGRRPRWPLAIGGSCEPQNAIVDVTVLGKPTGGSFTLIVTVNDVTENFPIAWNSTPTATRLLLQGHSEIGEGNVDVAVGTFPNSTVRIEFIGDLANTPIPIPTADWNGLTGGTGIGVICALAQLGAS